MRISDWSSDVCSSDLAIRRRRHAAGNRTPRRWWKSRSLPASPESAAYRARNAARSPAWTGPPSRSRQALRSRRGDGYAPGERDRPWYSPKRQARRWENGLARARVKAKGAGSQLIEAGVAVFPRRTRVVLAKIQRTLLAGPP